ncbi:hypothetical protein P153DRAFT_370148 [Dothidotthia symphoricarpi CBS 119687]|uniref:Uncharacterized protein n=1 Tax=Dothidotthia symphoricarpi CBS 119687 TaxID=1392245 RepID=A0A6A6A0H0_9PLEO|nr:uncharacterized protein P153DRAFT_370148 [Dothidotthia symphoricarpi CBS 119687]KAF2125492.1 hypothetical protein P153DRAFT_370148 [Dothidotthia symphoricarpi CBS 119687]
MDLLSQYGSYEFLPYLSNSSPPDTPQRSLAKILPSTQPQAESSLTLQNTSTWTYCGPLLVPNSITLPPSLHTWTTTTVSSPSAFFSRLLPLLTFLRTFLSEAGVHHYWLTVRATKPTTEYDKPRWHVDDDFFAPTGSIDGDRVQEKKSRREKSEARWKVCTTLLGPSTLFLPSPTALPHLRRVKSHQKKSREHPCTSVRCLGCADTGDVIRQTLAKDFTGEDVESHKYGEVAFFRLGDQKGAVHSEPKCDVDRIFINVVPGTEEEMRALMARWGMGFPRAWCFGVPVGLVRSDEFDRPK